MLERSTDRPDATAWAVLIVMAAAVSLPLARTLPACRHGAPGTFDLVAYWGAGQLLLAGESPYDFARLLDVQRAEGWGGEEPVAMWNPPILLVWIYPLLCLPFSGAVLAWYAIGIVATAACAATIWRDVGGSRAGRWLGLAWAAAFLFAPVRMTLNMGQISFLLLIGVAGFLRFASRGRDALAGLFLALTLVKPHVVYLVWVVAFWWMVRGRRWRFAAGVAGLVLPTLGLLVVVWPGALAGYRTILEKPPLHFLTPTLGGILRAVLGPEAGGVGPIIAASVALGTLGYLIARRPAIDWTTALGPLLLISVATAPYGWVFDQSVLLVPYLGLVALVARPGFPETRRFVVAAGLVAMSAVLVAENMWLIPEVYFFWSPWALAGLGIYARRPWAGLKAPQALAATG